MNYSQAYKELLNELKIAEVPDAETDLRLLFEYMLNKDRNFLLVHGNDEITVDDFDIIKAAVNKRKSRIPLQHITGIQEFMGIPFSVNENVLIPRFDTECLVEEVLTECCDGAKILDVCTGSGCILLSIMKYKNDIEGYGIDISEKALDVAKENAEKLLLSPTFIQSNMFENLSEKGFDFILSNPPYIKKSDIDSLTPEVKDYDPMLALDGGEDGLDFYRIIAEEAKKYLKIGGRLFLEIGNDQGSSVSELLRENGYKNIKVIKDYAGNDRIVSAG